jgi:Kef-type K+ transport system membrane component KefB
VVRRRQHKKIIFVLYGSGKAHAGITHPIVLAEGVDKMTDADLTSVLFVLLLLVTLAQLLGSLFVKLRQPRVIGEILAGILLAPILFGRFPIVSGITQSLSGQSSQSSILNFVYWMGLLLLMFFSGAETRQLFSRDERRQVAWLAIVGTGVPFGLGLVAGPWLMHPALAGPNGNRVSLIIILAAGGGGYLSSCGFQNFCRP